MPNPTKHTCCMCHKFKDPQVDQDSEICKYFIYNDSPVSGTIYSVNHIFELDQFCKYGDMQSRNLGCCFTSTVNI